MLKETLAEIFERDLTKLIEEIKQYKTDSSLWEIKEGISNAAGNLTLHLVGNLNHFIGAVLGNTGYVRNREEEFSIKNIAADQLIKKVEDTIIVVKDTLAKLTREDIERDFPVELFGKPNSTEWILVHLSAHLSYHLGQINYHRRLIS